MSTQDMIPIPRDDGATSGIPLLFRTFVRLIGTPLTRRPQAARRMRSAFLTPVGSRP
jgi:hypothetical protein